jgi:hypothetical protein
LIGLFRFLLVGCARVVKTSRRGRDEAGTADGKLVKLFECQNFGQPLYFENTHCESCGLTLGYLPARETVTALRPDAGMWTPLAAPDRHIVIVPMPRMACAIG